jgi:hypothetical protein
VLRLSTGDRDAGLILDPSDLGLAFLFREGANAVDLPSGLCLNRDVIGCGAPGGYGTGREGREKGYPDRPQNNRLEVWHGDHECVPALGLAMAMYARIHRKRVVSTHGIPEGIL